MDNSGNSRHQIFEDFPLLKSLLDLNAPQLVSFAALALALYIGGSTAYVLGVVVGLPSTITVLINHATIVHLSGQLTFMALVIFTLFKVSRLIVTGLIFVWFILIFKYQYGRKRPRGWRHPAIARLQRRMNNAVVEGRSHGIVILGARIAIAFVFCFSTFLTIVDGSFITYPSRILLNSTIFFGGLIAITGSMSAYRVAAGRTHKEFFNSTEGRNLAIAIALFVCMVFGMIRTLTMMQGSTVYYSFGGEVCQLAPMMPVYGGNLFFDRESYNFIVVSDNKIAFYIPHPASQKAPICI